MAEPRHHTPRSDLPTRGRAVAAIARAKGRPFMLWQQDAIDVTHEYDPNTGLYVKRTVVVSVPRQSGKTKMESDVADARCLMRPRARVWVTMQNGKTVDSWMRSEHFTDLAGARAFGTPGTSSCRYHLSRRAGEVGVLWPATGSSFLTFAPNRNALHSKQSDDVFVDEAWAHNAETGAEIIQAVDPTMATRPDPRLWVVSTQGDDSSVFLDNYLELGKSSLQTGSGTVVIIDYGIPEDAAIPEDKWALLELVAEHHPAYCPHPPEVRRVTPASPACRVCGCTITMATLEAAYEKFMADPQLGGLAGFLRAYGNRATRTKQITIPSAVWTTAGRPRLEVPDRVGIGLDATPSGSHYAISGGWRDDQGEAFVEVIDSGPTTSETPHLLARIARARRVPITLDRAALGALELVDAIAKIAPSVEIRYLNTAEYGSATGSFIRGVMDNRLHHFHQPELTDAVEVAGTRDLGDGGVGWRRVGSAGPIHPLVSATVALKGFDLLPRRRLAAGIILPSAA